MRPIIILFSWLVSSISLAGAIRGVVLPQEARQHKDSCFWRLGSKPASNLETHYVILSGSTLAKSSKGSKMALEGYRFVPPLVVVPLQSHVEFVNHDGLAYSCSSKGTNQFRFVLEKPQQRHEQQLISKEVLDIKCHRYPFMSATVVVEDQPFEITSTDPEGNFLFRQVPEGSYQIRAWSEGNWLVPQVVKVTAFGTVAVELSSQPATNAEVLAKTKEPSQAQPSTQVQPPVQLPVQPPKTALPEPKKTQVPDELPLLPPKPKKEEPQISKTPPAQKLEPEKTLPVVKKPTAKQEPNEPPSEKKQPKPALKPKPEKAKKPIFKDAEPDFEIEED